MAQIGADVDALRATVAMFRQGSSQISTAFAQAQQAMQALQSGPWAGQHRVQAEAIWGQISSRYTALVQVLDELTARTERFANALAETGREFRFGGAGVSSGTTPSSGTNSPLDSPESTTGTIKGLPQYVPFQRGSTTNKIALEGTGGCTNYVLRRVNLDDMNRWPDAHLWNEAAQKAGYVVDSRPAPGSIMVFERAISDPNYGHVAYVENVTQHSDGTVQVTISEAVYDGRMGTHSEPKTRTLTLKFGEDGKVQTMNGRPIPENSVSFILGRQQD
ncbi:MAG: hypothetical protein KatS3mg055_3026 [Chloroflexus sp.]|uniref:CHAP domain-containing protein n=1 Tax=Chloroflexus sp. TaxID=1904827 RepID=UPI0021DCC386|nr:CHAP domain-containing protein [Chloroflexus sp.]GIV90508.1 MAG: hypothetical protein KatS3mg055_3026 [Chloroflexus sp.]